MDFIAFDFETPNKTNSAPCSLGLVLVLNNVVVKSYSFLIDPEQSFSAQNIKIHGITASAIVGSPKFPEVWEQVAPLFKHYPVVSHNASFDKSVLEKVACHYGIRLPKITYYCTMKIAKENYPNLPCYTLDSLCDFFNISLMNHHCSLDDSCAAAEIMIKMLADPQNSIFACDISKPIRDNSLYQCSAEDGDSSSFQSRHGSPDEFDLCSSSSQPTQKNTGYFSSLKLEPDYEESSVIYDEVDDFVFEKKSFMITGDIANYKRSEIEAIIVSRGGRMANVSSKLDYLIVGMQNKNLIKDTSTVKSGKILQAEALREKGCPLKIVSDEFFISQLEVQNV